MKSPAFSFYVRDWLCSKTVSKLHSKGPSKAISAYLYLLCSAWLEDPPATLPSDDSELAGLARVSVEEWLVIKPFLIEQFQQLSNGRLCNERLMSEWEKQQKRKSAGSKGGSKKQANRVAASEDEIEDEDVQSVQNGDPNGEGGSLAAFEGYRLRVFKMVNRPQNERMGFDEESALALLIRERTNFNSEITLVEDFKNKCQPGYFPQSTVSLISKWQHTLERARNFITPDQQVPISIQIRTLEEAIDKHPANHLSSYHNPACSDQEKSDLKEKRAKCRSLKEAK